MAMNCFIPTLNRTTGFLFICLIVLSSNVFAKKSPPGPWNITSSLTSSQVRYDDNAPRDTLSQVGIMLLADYHDTGSIKLAYQHTDVKFSPSSGITNIKEKGLILGGKYHFYSDTGRSSIDLNLYKLEDKSNFTDDVQIVSSTFSYTNIARTIYIGLGISESRYRADNQGVEDMDVGQLSPTAGMSLNSGYDWFHITGYSIRPSPGNRLASNKDTSAMELTWTHWFKSNWMDIDNASLAILDGERVFTVDSHTDTIYNLADTQTGAVSFSALWKIGVSTRLLLSTGKSDFTSPLITQEYSSKYIHLNISTQW